MYSIIPDLTNFLSIDFVILYPTDMMDSVDECYFLSFTMKVLFLYAFLPSICLPYNLYLTLSDIETDFNSNLIMPYFKPQCSGCFDGYPS